VRGPSRLGMRCPHGGGSRRRSRTRSTRPTEMAGVALNRRESPANREWFKHPDPDATSVKVKIVSDCSYLHSNIASSCGRAARISILVVPDN
jgi:hypothetical protein